MGGAFEYLKGLAEGAAALAPTAGEVAGTLAGAAGVGAAATAGLAVGLAGGAAYGLARGTGWVHALPASAGQQGRGRAGRPVRQRHERRHAAPALHAAQRQQHFKQPRKQPRPLPVWLPRPGAGGLNPVTLPQSQPNSRAGSRSSGQSRSRHRGGVKNLFSHRHPEVTGGENSFLRRTSENACV